jgi:hypothetical protein
MGKLRRRRAGRIGVAAVAVCSLVAGLGPPAGARPIEPPPNARVVIGGAPCSPEEAGDVAKTSPGLTRLSAVFCGKAPGDPTHRWRPLDSSTHPLVGAIDRLYQAFYNRVPDGGGFAYWLNLRVDGAPLAAIAESFFAGVELPHRRRLAGLFTVDFVEHVYAQAFGRQPEPEALAYWLRLLDGGVITRAGMVLRVAESTEFRAKTHTA